MAIDDATRRPSADGGTGQPIDWAAALAEHGRWLRTVVRARLGTADGVDEVLQDVALAAVEQSAPLRDPAKLAPWLYRLAVVAALQYRRRMGRRRKLVDRYQGRTRQSEFDGRTRDPLDWLLAKEQRSMVRRALAELPRRDAEVLLLKYTENWTYRQMAEHLGLTASAVEARLHRARQKLRRGLAVLDPSLAPTPK